MHARNKFHTCKAFENQMNNPNQRKNASRVRGTKSIKSNQPNVPKSKESATRLLWQSAISTIWAPKLAVSISINALCPYQTGGTPIGSEDTYDGPPNTPRASLAVGSQPNGIGSWWVVKQVGHQLSMSIVKLTKAFQRPKSWLVSWLGWLGELTKAFHSKLFTCCELKTSEPRKAMKISAHLRFKN